MTQLPWPTNDVDDSTPNVARMHDYFLGGFHNFAADRELADGYHLLDPGLVMVEQWQPGTAIKVDDPTRYPAWAGIGRAR